MSAVLKRSSWAAGAPLRALLIGLIHTYRVTLGQLLGGQCRFYPSCSFYAEAAIREQGWIRGSMLAVWRVVRCNPFSPGGVDHPPRRIGRADPPVYDSVDRRAYDTMAQRVNIEDSSLGSDEVEGSGRFAELANPTGKSP